ncbi:MAG: fibronectin type III domain-containing protein [Syntrophobacteraceae bacterium]|nr:fibronectin type III domain-containing protein [Syntrophobacteraceae bacterium]
MRPASLSKYLTRLLSLLAILCLCQLVPKDARAQSYDLSGVWNFNGFLSGPGAPAWETGSLTVARDGTFTGSGTKSSRASDTPSGSFSTSSSGIEMKLSGQSSASLCMTDASNSIMSCTATLSDGSSSLTILSRQATSVTLADLAGTWQGSLLSSGPTSAWEQVIETIKSDGTFTGTYTRSDGATGATSGSLSISSTGTVSDAKDATYTAFVNPTATVMVATSGAATSTQDANLIVLTRQISSYTLSKLVGLWEVSSLASGPGAPWWQNGLLFVDPDGTCMFSSSASNGTSKSQNGSMSISPGGLVTLDLGAKAVGYVDPNMDIMVLTTTWSDGATHQLLILTNASSAALSNASTATWSTGATTSTPYSTSIPYSTPSAGYSSSTSPATSISAPGGSSAATTTTHPAGVAGNPQSAANTAPRAAGGQPPPSEATGGATAPPATQSAAPPQTATDPSAQSQAPTAPAVPGAPIIVVVTPGDSQALVNFKLPANDGGRPITQCTVTANPGGVKISRIGSPIHVSDLKNGTPYTFNVTTSNNVGTSPPSQTSKSITPGKVPDAPRILSVKTGYGQAEVSFHPPASSGGSDTTSYTVTASSGQKGYGSGSPIIVKGLAGGKPCTFTVTACNRTGTSRPSGASPSVTPR